ncbi:hypothetical protein HMPREF6485_2579 [Segatella buccae ATCC 33574]|uniref:Uncharacterized protein n=2 Tax=Segatella buccae TaxID=28126 RepID=E6KAE3_9BACT|nr:hypothetical protein HMPREF6485_2579 [Segatella buccae ATCC 33574]
MKHYQLWAVSAIACLALASCGNDDTVQGDGSQGEKELKGLTEFAVKVTNNLPPLARQAFTPVRV